MEPIPLSQAAYDALMNDVTVKDKGLKSPQLIVLIGEDGVPAAFSAPLDTPASWSDSYAANIGPVAFAASYSREPCPFDLTKTCCCMKYIENGVRKKKCWLC